MLIETVNLHIWAKCNLACTYCYGTFPNRPRSLALEDWQRILDEVKAAGAHRVTFSGGEPTLHRDLEAMLIHARAIGLQTSIVTNGVILGDHHLAHLDIVGITLDSANEATSQALGRTARGMTYLAHVTDVARRVHTAGARLKINTVVTSLNAQEHLGPELLRLRPAKWKPMQFTFVAGENDLNAASLEIGDATFRAFVERHRHLADAGIWLAPEPASTVRATYVMVDPQGRVFQHGPNGHRLSRPILEIGLANAVREAGGYDRGLFLARGGHVNIRRLPLVQGGDR